MIIIFQVDLLIYKRKKNKSSITDNPKTILKIEILLLTFDKAIPLK